MSRDLNMEVHQSAEDLREETSGAEHDDAQEEDTENASNILRRLSSPIFSTSGFSFNSDSDADNDQSLFFDDDKKDEGAETIQRWWQAVRQTCKRAKAAVAAKPAFERIQNFLDKLDAGQVSFEKTGLSLQNPDIQRAVAAALAAVPRDEALLSLPRSSRSARAVLSAVMIVYHQSEVLPSEGDTEQQPQQQQRSPGDTVASSTATESTAVSDGVPAVGPAATAAQQHTTSSEVSGSRRGRQKLNPSAAVLRNASALMLASVTAVTRSLGPVVAMEAGARKTLLVRLDVLRWSRRYFAVSLLKWKDADAQRVAAQVVQPYARAYAMRLAAMAHSDNRVTVAVQGQLDQYRRALEQLVGRERASHSLQEVELAVQADLREQAPPSRAPSTTSSSSSAPTMAFPLTAGSTGGADAAADGNDAAVTETPLAGGHEGAIKVRATEAAASSVDGGGGVGGAGEGAFRLPGGQLGRLLGNERLAHEIMVNPEFEIPDDDADEAKSVVSPDEELKRRFKDVMRRIFWDRFTQSLLPPPQSSNDGGTSSGPIKEGAKVHARYGSDRGSYYNATVLSVAGSGFGEEGEGVLLDVRYDEDGVVEKGIPLSRLRKGNDPPDFGPLLALLGEVREELISLTPNNALLVAEVRGVLAQDKLAEMLKENKLDARQVQRLVAFIAGRILDLQAPVRSDSARAWLKGFDAEMEAAATCGDALAVIPLLPRAFEFVFSQIEQIKRDVANAHIRLIGPYLTRHGVEYERAKFETRLASGAVSLTKTKAWVSSAVDGFLGEDVGEGGTLDKGERTARAKGLREGHEQIHRDVLEHAFVGLLRSKVRLDRPEAEVPETLAADGGRLAAARDGADRVALAATLCVLLRQVLARLRIGCPPPTMVALQDKVTGLLRQDGVSLQQIVEECVATARRLAGTPAKEGEGGGRQGLPAGEEEGLRSLLMSSADPSNEVFRVFLRRVLVALKGLVAGGDAGDLCGRHGLESFTGDLRPVGLRLRRLLSHNLKVFAGHYGPMVTEAAVKYSS